MKVNDIPRLKKEGQIDCKVSKQFKFVELNIPVEERVPEGYRLILAYVKDDDIVIPIAQLPEENEETIGLHNCDWEGCGSLDHIFRFSIKEKYKTR
jgi:hypothetical protein